MVKTLVTKLMPVISGVMISKGVLHAYGLAFMTANPLLALLYTFCFTPAIFWYTAWRAEVTPKKARASTICVYHILCLSVAGAVLGIAFKHFGAEYVYALETLFLMPAACVAAVALEVWVYKKTH